MTLEFINPDSLGRPSGFSHGILAPRAARVLFVAGQTARDDTGAVLNAGFVEQFARALDNVIAVVREAGGGPTDIARMTVYVTDMDAYRESLGLLEEVWRERMRRHYPAMALVEVRRLVDPGAVVEIEANAAIPQEEGQ